jgi:hypothetical protein
MKADSPLQLSRPAPKGLVTAVGKVPDHPRNHSTLDKSTLVFTELAYEFGGDSEEVKRQNIQEMVGVRSPTAKVLVWDRLEMWWLQEWCWGLVDCPNQRCSQCHLPGIPPNAVWFSFYEWSVCSYF